MDTGKVLGQIATRIRDQRLLFLIAVIVAVTILGRTETISALGVIIIFGISASVVLVDRLLDFLGARSGRIGRQGGTLGMSVAIDFEGLLEGTSIRLSSGNCTIQNPRNPGRAVTRKVVPYPQGSGWLCPLPLEAGPDDVVNIILTDADGGKWGMILVPRLLWPTVKADRLP